MLVKAAILSVSFFCLGSFCQAQAVRLDSRSTSPKVSQRLNQERLTAAESKLKAEKLNNTQSLTKTQRSTVSKAQKSSAIRSQRFTEKKKKRNFIDRDD